MGSADLATLYADSHSQKAEDHPAEIVPEATVFSCVDHPDAGFTIGVGYCGGGFGSYKRCAVCRRVFGKVAMRDGNQ